MTGTIRIWQVALLATVAALAMVLPSGAGAEEQAPPLRSGRLAGGLFYLGYASDCRSLPDCITWLQSGCDAELTGRDPAWLTSIEDVADLADGGTPRVFEWQVGGPHLRTPVLWAGAGVGWGGVVVQFWQEDCTEIRSSKWRSYDPDTYRHRDPDGATFPIPAGAKWMTVGTDDTVNIVWTLSNTKQHPVEAPLVMRTGGS